MPYLDDCYMPWGIFFHLCYPFILASSGTVFAIHLVILNCVDFGLIEVSE